MDLNKKMFPVLSLCGMQKKINAEPDFQRPAVWRTGQKQLLIDTILRGLDVPKLYWRRKKNGSDEYDVVDGQQRLRAIWEFYDGSYRLPKNAEDIDGNKVQHCSYHELGEDLRLRFETYNLDIVILDCIDEDEVREMFLRLQNGTSLKAQEKRNAYSGNMRDFIKDVSNHKFFKIVGFKNSRYTFDHIAAQCTRIQLHGGPVNVRNADLNKMYDEHKDFDPKGKHAKEIVHVFDELHNVFREQTPELERYNVIALFCLIADLRSKYVYEKVISTLKSWFIKFEQERKEKTSISPEWNSSDPEWTVYKERTSHSTDSEESIRFRLEFIMKRLMIEFPNMKFKDKRREFSPEQRLAIYRRDGGRCQIQQKCDSEKVAWDNWHCDHIVPHSKGGETTVSNGQVACVVCNLEKNNRQ